MENCIQGYYQYFIKNDEAYTAEEFHDFYKVEGKCIYEVLRVINSKPLFLKDHLLRLEKSLRLASENSPVDLKTIKKYVNQLISLNRVQNGNIKIVINQGNLYIFSVAAYYPTEEMYKEGVKTILYFGERTNPNAKVVDNSFREKVTKEMEAKDAFEAILINNQGFVTEGSKSNIFMIKGDTVYTAPAEGVLLGITRDKIIRACEELNLTVEEKELRHEDIKNLDGLFISGTSPKVLPINEVEDVIKFGRIYEKIYDIKEQYEKIIEEDLDSYSVKRW